MEDYIDINKKAYDASAADYAAKADSREAEYNEMFDFFSRYLNKDQKVLECGPGNGVFANKVGNVVSELDLIEFSEPMSRVAKENAPEANVIVAEFLEHEFTKKYDVVIGIQFVHLFQDPELERVVQKIKNILRPNGLVLLTTTLHKAHMEGFQGKKSFSGEPKRYRQQFSEESFKTKLSKFGLRLVEYSEIYPDVETQDNAIGYIRSIFAL